VTCYLYCISNTLSLLTFLLTVIGSWISAEGRDGYANVDHFFTVVYRLRLVHRGAYTAIISCQLDFLSTWCTIDISGPPCCDSTRDNTSSVRNREVLLEGSLIHRRGSAHARRSRGPDSVPFRTPLASARRTFINLIVTCFYAVFKILLK